MLYIVSSFEFKGKPDQFIKEYGLDEKSTYETIITLTYFAFTTLSTVGLGDISPISNLERILGSFIMLFGVMITSIQMDELSMMIQEFRNFNKNYEESDSLNLFLSVLKKYNKDVDLS